MKEEVNEYIRTSVILLGPHANPRGRCYYDLPFTDEKTDMKTFGRFPGAPALMRQSLALQLGSSERFSLHHAMPQCEGQAVSKG